MWYHDSSTYISIQRESKYKQYKIIYKVEKEQYTNSIVQIIY